MKYTRFEDLPVWKSSIDLAQRIFALVEDGSFRSKGDLANQLQRASLSVSNNIAEGFERGTTRELITFLYYSRGSAGEVRSMLRFCEGGRAFGRLEPEVVDLISLAESVSRQIRAWADHLQNTEIRGQRYLNDEMRDRLGRKERVARFLEHLEQVKRGSRPGEDQEAGN